MRIQPEAPAGPVRERAARSTAFGLALEVDPGIEIPGIPDVEASGVSDLDPPAPARPV
jgi:hypothetical protein